MDERVRIAELNQVLPDEKWRVKLTGKLVEDLAVFNNAWNQLGAISSARVMKYDFDGRTALRRNARASRPCRNWSRHPRFRSSHHLKMQTISGSLLLYGVEMITNVHSVKFGFERGYTRLSLTEIV